MDEVSRRALEGLLRVGIRSAQTRGGDFTASRCWSLDVRDGRRVFAKVAADEEAAAGNRIEAIVLGTVRSSRLPALVASTDDGRVLVTEDLSDADWQPHLGDLAGLWAAIVELGSMPGPRELSSSYQGAGRDPWAEVLADDRFDGAVGIDAAWLAGQAPALSAAAKRADTSGDGLVHGDLAPSNWCGTPDGL